MSGQKSVEFAPPFHLKQNKRAMSNQIFTIVLDEFNLCFQPTYILYEMDIVVSKYM